MKHTPEVHPSCQKMHCHICDGGLFHCTTCGGVEGSLPTDCPGFRLTGDQHDEIYAGRLDFRDGQWVGGAAVATSGGKA